MDSERAGAAAAPLIVTAALDRDTAARFEGERRAHFPATLNRVPAHLTLFHALPPSEAGAVADRLRAVVRGGRALGARCVGLFHLGRGVAYRIDAPELERLRAELADAWAPLLGSQDRAPFRPHVTIQNKVTPAGAKALLTALEARFVPFGFGVIGLDLWWYRGGAWEAAGAFRFR